MKGWSANCMFIFYIPLLCSFHVYCAAKHSLKFGESIKDNGETLVSAGGEFELGFFTPNGRYGIQTVNLTDFGNLEVYNKDKQMPVWESFKYPTDTFLPVPGMSMDSNLILTSWRDRDDPGRGSFTFKVELVEDKKTLSIEKEGKIYWKNVDYGQLPLSKEIGKLEFWNQSDTGTVLMQAEPRFMPNVPQKWHSGDFSDGCALQTATASLIHINKQGKCWIWKQDLVNLQEEHPDGNNLFVRVAISDIEQTVRNCKPCGTNMIPYPLSTSSNCGDPMYFSFYCNTTSGQVSFKGTKWNISSYWHVQDLIDAGEFNEEDEKGIDVPFYDLESILVATDNFSNENKLGQGGYGPVFKGKLPSGQEIAVKRLSSVSSQGLQEFKNEVVLIAKLQHRNLVLLEIISGRKNTGFYQSELSNEPSRLCLEVVDRQQDVWI
uniref:Protein kinase domain-containing protein n=1 Tax=Fagus sylvatica TaxID=28930 RepID=A0A2N9H967_FAGSY